MARAGLVIWAVLSVGALGPVVLAVVAPRFLESVSSWLSAAHDGCALCGMTRAYVAMGRGLVGEAAALNAAAPPLFMGGAVNACVAVAVFVSCSRRTGGRERVIMQVFGLILGILAFVGMGVGMFPCVGSLNWVVVPFGVLGIIINGIALGTAAPDQPKGMGIAGLILSIIAVILGAIRLVAGGGIV